MEDIEYFQRKLIGAMQIPRAYLGQDEGLTRQTLSSEDVQFARTIIRVQGTVKLGIEKLCRVHLAAINLPPEQLEFEVEMTVPSAIYELAQIEVRTAQANLAASLRDILPNPWIMKHVFHLSKEEINETNKQRDFDVLHAGELQNKAASAGTETGGGEENAEVGSDEETGYGGESEAEGMAPEGEAEAGTEEPQAEESVKIPRKLVQRHVSHLLESRRSGIPDKELLAGQKRDSLKLDNLMHTERESVRRLAELRTLVKELSLLSFSKK